MWGSKEGAEERQPLGWGGGREEAFQKERTKAEETVTSDSREGTEAWKGLLSADLPHPALPSGSG